MYDVEILREISSYEGIENYSRMLSGRRPDSTPFTLFDYFLEDFLLFAGRSHVLLSQIRPMHTSGRAREETLINFGFHLLSAYDNRPLDLGKFYEHVN